MRADPKLKYHYQAIISYTGLNCLLIGILMLTPLFIIPFWHEERMYALDFIFPATILIVSGILMWKIIGQRKEITFTVQDGGVVVLLSWAIACVFSSFPLITIQRLDITQAIFESVSGWTTTGLSVVDVTIAPHIILIWRSIIQLVGGAGLAITMLATITGPVGPGLSIAEGRTDQLAPHVRASAKLVATIYIGYAIVGILAYRLAGMNTFDSINHAFTAISTGGFSTRPESIGYWNSEIVEITSIFLMIFGNLNFLTAYLLLHGKFMAIYRNGEIRIMTILIPIAALLLSMLVCRDIYPVLSKNIRVSIFESISALTTTGFSTVTYNNWNTLGFFVMTILMIIGGGTCSTAGGVKQYRIYLLYKCVLWELKRPFLPATAVIENYVWQGEKKSFIKDDHIRQVATFAFLYCILYVIGSGIIAAHGYGLRESLFEFASSLSTVGLSCGLTLPASPPLVLWTETIGMFLGRLEFFVVFVSLGKIARDLFSMLTNR